MAYVSTLLSPLGILWDDRYLATITDSSGKTIMPEPQQQGPPATSTPRRLLDLCQRWATTPSPSARDQQHGKSITDTVTAVNPLTLTAVNGTFGSGCYISSGYAALVALTFGWQDQRYERGLA